MRLFSRLILFLLVCACFPLRAQVTYSITALTFTGTGSTVSAAAASVAQQYTNAKYPICVQNGQTLATDQARVKSVSGLVVVFERYAPAGTPCVVANRETTATATQSGQVSCPSNQEVGDSGSCECKAIRNAGSFMVTGDHYDGCNQGCSMVLSSGWYDKTANTTWGTWNQTGSSCTAGTPSVLTSNDPKVEAAKQCASGTCPGTVNGQSVCVPCDKTKQTESTSSSTSASTTASGATSSTTITGSESGTTRTECKDGQCTTTTTTTTTGANGDKTDKTTTTTEPQSDYCTRNPKADVCKGTESSWGGSCESGFTCDGDAVQCAQARASYELRCKITETDSEVIGKYNALKAEGLEGLHLPAMNITPPTPEAFGGCPIQDISIDLGFGPMAFPLSYVCPYLEVIHRVVTSFGALFWLLIVFLKGD